MGPVGLIQQHRQAAALHRSNQASQIPHQALIAGRHQHHRRQGALGQGRLQLLRQPLRRGRQPQAGGGIKGQIKQHRPQLAQQAAMQQGAMQIAGQQHPLARLSQGQ